MFYSKLPSLGKVLILKTNIGAGKEPKETDKAAVVLCARAKTFLKQNSRSVTHLFIIYFNIIMQILNMKKREKKKHKTNTRVPQK